MSLFSHRKMSTRLAASIRVGDVSKNEPLKRNMAKWYTEYAKKYDLNGYHTKIAKKLVDGLAMREGQRILDIAAGTGLAGMAAIETVGPTGSLVCVDISPDMLNVAQDAFDKKGITNVEFILADAQKLDLEEKSFDILICSSALVLFPDVKWTLEYWKQFLVPGGQIALHCFSEDSYIRGKLIQKAASEFGIELIFSEPTGTVEKCQSLLETCGYTSIRIERVESGNYASLDAILNAWERMIVHPMVELPSRVPDPSLLESIHQRYIQLAHDTAENDQLWDEDTIMYVYGIRPLDTA